MEPETPNASIVRKLAIAVFGLNGRLVETGNHLVGDIGLTTAWWQVLGALGYSPVPLPVAHIARNMGLSRQSVQRTIDLLAERKLVRFDVNPHHQRAKLAVLTVAGRAALVAAEAAENPLNQVVFDRIGGNRIAAALKVLTEFDEIIAKEIDAGMGCIDKEKAVKPATQHATENADARAVIGEGATPRRPSTARSPG